MTERPDRSNGFEDGDVVLLLETDGVIRYDAVNDAWWSAGPESWSVHGEFNFTHEDAVMLLYRKGDYNDEEI